MSKVKNGSISFLTFDILISGWPETNHINVNFCGDWLAGVPTNTISKMIACLKIAFPLEEQIPK